MLTYKEKVETFLKLILDSKLSTEVRVEKFIYDNFHPLELAIWKTIYSRLELVECLMTFYDILCGLEKYSDLEYFSRMNDEELFESEPLNEDAPQIYS
jgi:hypothetical protein